MAGETHFAPQPDLEPRRVPSPDLRPADASPKVDVSDAVQPAGGPHAAAQRLATPALRHPSAIAHRTAAAHDLQRHAGNQAVQKALRKEKAPVPGKSESTKKTENKQADAKVAHPDQDQLDAAAKKNHPAGAHGKTNASVIATHVHVSTAEHHAPDAPEGPGAAESALTSPVSDAEALAALHTEWSQAGATLTDAEPLMMAFAASANLNLRLAPAPKTDPAENQGPDPKTAIQEATTAFAHLNQEAGRSHREVLDRGNDIRRDLVVRGRQAALQIELNLDEAVVSVVQTLDVNRAALLAAAGNATKALDRNHHIARVTLAGAAGTARKSISAARTAVDKGIDEIQKDLLQRFKKVYDDKADKLAKAAKDASAKLRSPETQQAVANQFGGQKGLAVGIQLAQEEAQRAAVPKLLENLATGIDKNSKAQVDILRRMLTYPQKDGSTIESIVKQFTQTLKEAAVGGGKSAPAPATPAAGGAKGQAAAKKNEPLYDQATHAVDLAFGRTSHALEEQFKAASDALLHARESAILQLAAQRSAAFAQLSGIRKAHLTAISKAVESGLHSIEGGIKAGLPGYQDASRKSAKSLEDASLRGAQSLSHLAREGLSGAQRSVEEARVFQLHRLDQVATGASATIDRQSGEAFTSAAKTTTAFDSDLLGISAAISKDMLTIAEQQTQGLSATAHSVAQSALAFTKPLPVQFKKVVDDQKALWFPDPPKPEPKSDQKTPEEIYADLAEHAKAKIEEPEDNIASELRKKLAERAGSAGRALHKFNLDEDGLLAALRGITNKQGIALSVLYSEEWPGENLENKIFYEYDRYFVGLNKNEYNAAINYLHGNTAKGALWELKESKGWFSTDGKRAEQIMRDMTKEERKQLLDDPDWKEVASSVKGGLSSTDLKVFDALEKSDFAVANAIRVKQNVDKARENNDKDAYFKAIQNYSPPGTDREDQRVSFADMQHAFVGLLGPEDAAQAGDKRSDAEIFKSYVTRPVTVDMPDGDGGSYPVTYKIEGPDLVLAEALSIKGPGSDDARAARLFRESERKDGKPDLPELENAVVDPRLNKSLYPKLSDKDRDEIRQEQDKVFLAYAKLRHQYHPEIDIKDATDARYDAAQLLRSHYDEDSEKGWAGATYVSSIVTKDVPDGAAGIRYAILGLGTDEDLVHRNLQRMSRAEVDNTRAIYKSRYGDDLDSDLGTDGSWFGDLSGDDLLQAKREMMGVPQTDKERWELAYFTVQQQQDEAGVAGAAYNEGSAEEKGMLGAKQRLMQGAGGVVLHDKYGRPIVVGGHFDSSGKYTGENINQLNLDMDLAAVTAQNYAARIDDLASLVTTAIAIAGAVAAAVVTVVTAGAASPLLMAAIAGVSGALAIGANELIRGGHYGWEQAALDLGMTGVQMISAGVGQSLALAARGGTAAVAAGMRTLVVQNLPKEMTRLAGSQFANMVLMGAVTGGISGLGGAILNEHTWEKGLGEGIKEAMLGMVKGALAGGVTSAVTSTLDQSKFFGAKLQELSAEGGLLKGGLNVLGRGLGRSAISATGAIAGRGTELAFDAATGKFHGNLNDALTSLGEAGREAGIRGLFEGAGEAVGKRYENRIEAAKHQAAQTERTTLTPVPGEEPIRTGAPKIEETVEMPKAVPATATERTLEHELAELRAARGKIEAGDERSIMSGAKTGEALSAHDDARIAELSSLLERANIETTEGRRALVAAKELATHLGLTEEGAPRTSEAAAVEQRVPRLDEQAAAGIAGSRATGDAAQKFGLRPADMNSVVRAVDSLVGEGGASSRFATQTEDGRIEVETRQTAEGGEPVKVKVRIEMIDSLPLEKGLMPVAMFEAEGASGYVIRVSRGAPAASVERALAHELAEIRAVHGKTDVEQQHALTATPTPGEPPPTKLSPHDEGRLAELEVLMKRANAETVDGRRALDEVQRLAAHLGLTGESEAAANRRALALGALGEETAKFLSAAIERAAGNPYLKPLTGDLHDDIRLLGERLKMAQDLGELPQDPRQWRLGEGRLQNPVAVEAAEQIRQMLIRDQIVELKYGHQGAYDPRVTDVLRNLLPPEMSRLFDFALSNAQRAREHYSPILESQLDQNTLAATRTRFGDFEKFQDWSVYKTKYLEANPGLKHESLAGEFADPVAARRAFDKWATGNYIADVSGYPRSVLSEVLDPTPGFEARFLKDPDGLNPLQLAKEMIVVQGKVETPYLADDAATARNNALVEAARLRAEAEALKVSDPNLAATKIKEAQEWSQKAIPFSEAFGVLAGRAAAAELFPGGSVFEFHGSNVPDLLIVKPDGKIGLIECKGGGSELGTRKTKDGMRVVEQGTREYAQTIAEEMVNSKDPVIRAKGGELLKQLADPNFELEYYLVQQDFANGKPLPPEVKQFDTTPRKAAPAAIPSATPPVHLPVAPVPTETDNEEE